MVKTRKYIKSRHNKRGKIANKKTRRHVSKNKRTKNRGGKCGCQHKKQRGGYGPGACPIGYSWEGSNVDTWPGAIGNPSSITMSNHYSLSKAGVGPAPPPISSRNQNGGGRLTALMPQDLVNFGRSITSGVTGVIDGWKGIPVQASSKPLPTNQPINSNYKYIGRVNPINITKIHTKAGETVAKI